MCALASTGILDTEPEGTFDAITRLSAEYFQADTVLLGFADASRVWIKSYWGEAVRELPRSRSIFEMVLAENGSVVVPDISKHPQFEGGRSGLCAGWRLFPSPVLRCARRMARFWEP